MKGRIFEDCSSSEQVNGVRWFWHGGIVCQVGIITKVHSVFAGNLVKYVMWCYSAFDSNAAWQKYFRLSFTRKVRFWQGETTTENTRESRYLWLAWSRSVFSSNAWPRATCSTVWALDDVDTRTFVFLKSFLVFDTVHHPTQIAIRIHASKRESLSFQALWFNRYFEARASVYK